MPEAYDIHELRLVQQRSSASAADALSLVSAAVPADKIWTVRLAFYYPSASESRTVWWGILDPPAANGFPTTVPVTITLSNLLPFPLLTEGNEIKLYPGEKLYVYRNAATAGSTMQMVMSIIESDLPYYAYVEPLRRLVAKRNTRVSQAATSGGGASFRGEASEPGGRGGGPESI